VVRYARSLPGTTKVVLIGHSSGGPLMSAYQAIAENGVAFCRGPRRLSQCPDTLANLPRADGLILLDPIFGVGANVLTSVDPAVTDERRPRALDPRLDSFNPANGFARAGAHYPDGFRAAYFAAQARRNNALIEGALAAARRVAAGQGQFVDDEPFLAAGANRRPRIWQPDLSMLSHTRGAYPLIHGDGQVTTEVIRSVRVPSGTTPTTPVLNGGSLDTSAKRFLSTFATRALPGYRVTEDSIEGVDWASSYTNTPSNVEGVTVPFLVMGMTGHYWLVSAEMAYQRVRSADRSIAFVEGATHGFTPCAPCARTPGEFGDTVAHTFDYIAAWLGPRF
jgi:pimeloyl-ACP methyl ester carboxylesterase